MRDLPEVRNWVVIPQNQLALSKEKSLASCPAAECGKEFEFEPSETRVFESRYHFSSAVTSTVRNCKRAEDRRVFLAGYVDRVSHLILSISRQNALRMAPAETPNS